MSESTKDQLCLCRAHPKHGFWLDINCPEHGNRYKQDQEREQFGPLFEFKTRRETEKAIAVMLPGCDCEGPQKIGPGYHAPYCSAHPWCPNCGGKDGEHKPGCEDGSEIL